MTEEMSCVNAASPWSPMLTTMFCRVPSTTEVNVVARVTASSSVETGKL